MKLTKGTDAVVDMDDALRWITQLFKEPDDDVIELALHTEPFVLGLAIDTANRLASRMRRANVPPSVIKEVHDKMVLSSAYAIALLQRGYRKLHRDQIEPDGPEGDPHA